MRARTHAITDLVVARRSDPRAEPDTPPAPKPVPTVDETTDTATADEALLRYHHLARVGLVRRVLMAERPGPVRVAAREVDGIVRRPRAATG